MTRIKNILSKIDINAPFTLSFLAISAIALFLGKITNGQVTSDFFTLYGGRYEPATIFRIFSSVFGHVNLNHYIGNALFLIILGPMLEEKYGYKGMISMTLLTAAMTGILNVVFFPHFAVLGASGIVFMMIILSSFVNHKKGTIPLTFILCMALYLGREISNMLSQDSVSQFSHIIGGLSGAAIGFIFAKGQATKEVETTC